MTANKMKEMMIEQNLEAYTKWDTEALLQCQNCGRTFLPEPLERHQRSCKAGRPLKARTGTTLPGALLGGGNRARQSVSPTKTAVSAA